MSTIEQPGENPEEDKYLSQEERDQLRRLLSQPAEFPREFGAWIQEYFSVNGSISQSQVQGLAALGVFSDYVASEAGEVTAFTTYGDLATPGPVLFGLRDGRYIFLYGAQTVITSGSNDHAILSPSFNGVPASDTDSALAYLPAVQNHHTPMTARLKTLTNGNNTVVMKYRTNTGASIAFLRRWLIGIRYGNA